jgi:hypothetical protein
MNEYKCKPCECDKQDPGITSTYNGRGWTTITGYGCGCDVASAMKTPYFDLIPAEVHVNEDEQVINFVWSDGTSNKVTCDDEDNFSIELGYCVAITERILGGKKNLKEKVLPIIARRIENHGDIEEATLLLSAQVQQRKDAKLLAKLEKIAKKNKKAKKNG